MKASLFTLLLLGLASSAFADTVLNRGNGAEPESLDPAFAGSVAEQAIVGDLMVGLTTLDASARPIAGIARSWETSRDGLTWTFHLRTASWSDGSPLTAQDFVYAWRRLVDPKTASRNAQILWVIKNGAAITAGKLPSAQLGASAPNRNTLVVTLEHPAPYLPQLLSLACAAPVKEQAVANNANWSRAGRYVSDGPYLLKSWVPNDRVTLVKNPRFYDAQKVRISTVNYFPTADSEAGLRRFRANELDMQTPIPSAQIAWMNDHLRPELHIVPSLALAYIVFNMRDAALSDYRIRRALNLVYDREIVASKVMKLGEAPAYSYVPPGIANFGPRVDTGYGRKPPALDFRDEPSSMRVAQAQKLMEQAGYGRFNRLRLTLLTSSNPDSLRLSIVFQAMARQIYVDIAITRLDYPLVLRAMRQGQFQMGYTTWIGDFNDASNFLDLLRSNNPNNYAGYKNAAFDAAMAAADRQIDTTKRAQLMEKAETLALRDLPWLAVRYLSQSQAVGPHVGGYVENIRQINLSRWLWIKP